MAGESSTATWRDERDYEQYKSAMRKFIHWQESQRRSHTKLISRARVERLGVKIALRIRFHLPLLIKYSQLEDLSTILLISPTPTIRASGSILPAKPETRSFTVMESLLLRRTGINPI